MAASFGKFCAFPKLEKISPASDSACSKPSNDARARISEQTEEKNSCEQETYMNSILYRVTLKAGYSVREIYRR